MQIISRKFYLQEIENYIDKAFIKVITGQRRAGKTLFLEELSKKFEKKEVVYINMENKDFCFLKNDDDLNNYLEKEIKNGKKYIFCDEIQSIISWEKAINSLFSKYRGKVDIYISGSNSSLLSGELATLLTGRYVQFQIFPFSYEEFLQYFKKQKGLESFNDYINIGGLSLTYEIENKEIVKNIISSIIDTIIVKDLIPKYGIKDIALLKEIFIFIVSNIGNITNISNIVNYLKSQKIDTNHNTVASYIEILKSAYLIYEANLYDIKGKKIFNRERKFYIGDHVFKDVFLSPTNIGMGNVLENIVYIMGLRKGYNIFVGKLMDKEIDFVFEKNGKRLYIQVCYLLIDEKVIVREFGNLEKIADNWEKYVVSMDILDFGVRNGIKHIKVWELNNRL